MATGDLYIKKDGVYTPVTPHVYRGARGEPETALYIIDRNKMSGAVNQPVPLFIRDPICFANLGADWSRLWVYDRNQLPVNAEVVYWDEVNNFAIIYVAIQVNAPDQLNFWKTSYKTGQSVNPSIGGIGSAPGIAVWAAQPNYQQVWHLVQDLGGDGTGFLKDSLGNVDAEPIGFTANPVEVYQGIPATRFNGVDQYFWIAGIYDARPTDTFLLQATFNDAGTARLEDGAGLIVADYTGDDIQYTTGWDNANQYWRTGYYRAGAWVEALSTERPPQDQWNVVQGIYDKVTLNSRFNRAVFGSRGATSTIIANNLNGYIGRRYNTSGNFPYLAGLMSFAAIGITRQSEPDQQAWETAHAETLFDVYLGEAAPAGWEPVDEVYYKANGVWAPEGPSVEVKPLEAVENSAYANRAAIYVFTGAGVGSPDFNSWMSANNISPNKFNAKFEDPEKFLRFIINNWGGSTTMDRGVQNINIYGTNEESAYLNTTPGDVTDCTLLASAVLAQNTLGTQDVAEWQTIEVDEAQKNIAYKYVVFDCLDNYGNSYTGIYHIRPVVRA